MLLEQCWTVHVMRTSRASATNSGATETDHECIVKATSCQELLAKNLINTEQYCERGLESYLSEERRIQINSARKHHKLSVINEHGRQGKLGMRDPELLRSVSLNLSRTSTLRAELLALIDQKEARADTHTTSNNSNEIQKQNGIDQKHERSQQMSENQLVDENPIRGLTPLDILWLQRDHKHKGMIDASSRALATKTMDKNTIGSNSFEHIKREDNRIVAAVIQQHLIKQQALLGHLLFKQQRQRAQFAQLQYHSQDKINALIGKSGGSHDVASSVTLNSVLAPLQLQECLLQQRQNQQQQRQLQQRLEHQCRTQQHVQRLLLLHQLQSQSLPHISAAARFGKS